MVETAYRGLPLILNLSKGVFLLKSPAAIADRQGSTGSPLMVLGSESGPWGLIETVNRDFPLVLSLSKDAHRLKKVMAFYTYILKCSDGSFYTGHTDNLEQRFAQHQSGYFTGYTFKRRPVELVWSENFSTRYEALEAEKRIKGWTRVKKARAD